jgi:hypothetical protein
MVLRDGGLKSGSIVLLTNIAIELYKTVGWSSLCREVRGAQLQSYLFNVSLTG